MPTDALTHFVSIRKALVRERIELQERLAAISHALGGEIPVPFGKGPKIMGGEIPVPFRKGRRPISPEGRARIAEAQRLRWARNATDALPTAANGKPKRTMSAAGRARIAAAAKARWAKKKAAGSNGAASAEGGKKKRVMSPEARARIAAAQKARWAKQKKEEK